MCIASFTRRLSCRPKSSAAYYKYTCSPNTTTTGPSATAPLLLVADHFLPTTVLVIGNRIVMFMTESAPHDRRIHFRR